MQSDPGGALRSPGDLNTPPCSTRWLDHLHLDGCSLRRVVIDHDAVLELLEPPWELVGLMGFVKMSAMLYWHVDVRLARLLVDVDDPSGDQHLSCKT